MHRTVLWMADSQPSPPSTSASLLQALGKVACATISSTDVANNHARGRCWEASDKTLGCRVEVEQTRACSAVAGSHRMGITLWQKSCHGR